LARRIYLDHAATTPVAPEVVDAMLPFLREQWGNPSSPHGRGRRARSAVDDARDRLAAVLHCAPRELTFTSGGTESDNLAVRGALQRWGSERGRHVVVSAIEHEAVLTTATMLGVRGDAEVTVVGSDESGRIDPERVAAAVRDDTILVSLMLANNEVGTVQDVADAARRAHQRNPRVLVHSDAVQALGRMAVDPAALGVDLLSLSAHKCYGAKGCGLLYARWGSHLGAQMEGGGQERGRRSGTENVAAIAGFAVAAELVEHERDKQCGRQSALRDSLEASILEGAPRARVAAAAATRLPNLSALLIDGASAEAMVAALDIAGLEVSSGSACSSGAAQPSHVMTAIGEDPRATALLRLSLGRQTSAADVADAAERILAAIGLAATPSGAPATRAVSHA
jgi:cysteine desulfurase